MRPFCVCTAAVGERDAAAENKSECLFVKEIDVIPHQQILLMSTVSDLGA